MPREFRFGVELLAPASRSEWITRCRRAEDLGFDVLLVPDHLGFPAPFPSLIMAAEATEALRVGTFVLNAGFWNPALLAREAACANQFTEGRLELGIGTGYVKAEFERAGLPWENPAKRVDRLERTVTEVTRLLAEPFGGVSPLLPEQPGQASSVAPPPLLIGGAGRRVLKLAACHADVVAFTGMRSAPDGRMTLAGPEALAGQVAWVDRHAKGRRIEKNIVQQWVVPAEDRRAAAEELRDRGPDLSVEELLELPSLLLGTPRAMAEQLERNRERYGFSYITVLESAMEAFARVIAELR